MIQTIVMIAASLTGQAAPTPPTGDGRTPAAARMAVMKDSVRIYDFDRDAGPIVLRPEPAFRLGDQGNGVQEGAIFLWDDATGRPEAAAQVFLHRRDDNPEGVWLHEFTSLSVGTFAASQGGTPRWTPAGPGVTFRPVPGAPAPAPSPAGRLRQMRALAADFKAEDDFGDHGRFTPLRLLPTPVARYGKPGATPEDGALFAFVEGTDPEVFLFVEARPGAAGTEWQYACAPMSCWPLKVTQGGRIVWEVPRRATDDPTKPFFCREYRP